MKLEFLGYLLYGTITWSNIFLKFVPRILQAATFINFYYYFLVEQPQKVEFVIWLNAFLFG